MTIRRMLLASITWLTAAATLLAGTPHFVCRCAREHEPPAGFEQPTTTSSCPCGGECCAQSQEKSCCDQAGQAGGQSNNKPADNNCVQSLSRPQDLSPASTKTTVVKDLTPGPFCLPTAGLVSLAPQPDHSPSFWSTYAQPPPTDLVIALQHFLI